MGSLFSPSEQRSTSTSQPWGPQQGYLTDAFGNAQDLYNSRSGTPFYQGDLYAGMDPLTTQGLDATQDYATGAGAAASGNVLGAGQGLLGTGQQAAGAYSSLYGAANRDPTQANIRSAGQYADNPYMDGMIDSASRDVSRNLFENQIPGLNAAATGSGNMNSSRAGAAEGIMRRGAADQVGDIASNMRGQAYSQGLGLAENARTSNMGFMGQAGAGFGNMFGQGLGAAQLGQNMNYQNTDALIRGGQLNQADQQGQLNADFMRWQGSDNREAQLLQQYYGIVGGNNWGGTTTGTTPGASPFQNILGAGATIGGLALSASERRVKHNIVPVSSRSDGLTVYDFDYRKGYGLANGRQRGVMRDEVAQLRPDALGPTINGIGTVNYSVLGDEGFSD